ncbi:MAG: hypothetical protein KGH95_03635, partial [Thaumarchaeota archaeon]|nr:hypothetical protein [Nitrososphaerota archaeon]
YVIFCNCTGTADDVDPHENTKNLEAWGKGNFTIYAYPNDGKLHDSNYYVFEFFKQGYHVVIYTDNGFYNGMQMILDTFFNGTKISDLEQMPLNYKYR